MLTNWQLTCKYLNCIFLDMLPKDTRDPRLSSEKPKHLPWTYWFFILGLIGLFYLYILFKD